MMKQIYTWKMNGTQFGNDQSYRIHRTTSYIYMNIMNGPMVGFYGKLQ